MIFAAGLGTRLSPLTEKKPKALVRINDKSMLEYQLEKLEKAGFKNIILNVHHFSKQIIEFVKNYNKTSIKIQVSDESDELLDTGGGLIKALPLYQDDHEGILVHNVDIFSDLNLKNFYNHFRNSDALALLAVRKRNTQRYLLFDDEMELCGWTNVRTGEKKIVRDKPNLKPYAFSGIHCLHPDIIKETTFSGKCSIVDIYLEMARFYTIKAYVDPNDFWMDAGSARKVRQLAQIL